MPVSTDNQDFTPNEVVKDKNENSTETLTGPALGNMTLGKDVGTGNSSSEKATEDENNFDSDNLKGKKVDGDPSKESDQPAILDQE